MKALFYVQTRRWGRRYQTSDRAGPREARGWFPWECAAAYASYEAAAKHAAAANAATGGTEATATAVRDRHGLAFFAVFHRGKAYAELQNVAGETVRTITGEPAILWWMRATRTR